MPRICLVVGSGSNVTFGRHKGSGWGMKAKVRFGVYMFPSLPSNCLKNKTSWLSMALQAH